MTGHGSKFERKKEHAIAALLTSRNVEEAAHAVGVTAKTMKRWMHLPDFAEDYRNARREAFSQAIARLQQASGAAVATLLKVMVDTTSPPTTRLRAADSVLNHGAKAIEIEDIEARLMRLERASALPGVAAMISPEANDGSGRDCDLRERPFSTLHEDSQVIDGAPRWSTDR